MPLAMFLNDTPFELEERQSNERGRAIEVTVGSLPELHKTSSLVLGALHHWGCYIFLVTSDLVSLTTHAHSFENEFIS